VKLKITVDKREIIEITIKSSIIVKPFFFLKYIYL
jgi:hypothetical protein